MGFSHRQILEYPIAIISESVLDIVPLLSSFRTLSLEPQAVALPAGTCPHLVLLDGASPDLRVALLDELESTYVTGEPRGLLALLGSNAPVDQVASHLRSMMFRRKPGSDRYWIRLHDPRVFMHLPRILSPAQLHGLMGSIDVWCWRDLDLGTWTCTARPAEDKPHDESWSESQWDAVFRVELVNRTAREIARLAPGTLASSALHERIDAALRRAIEQEGMVSTEDQQAFAVDAVLHGDALFLHPVMKRCLSDMRQSGGTYLGATADLDLEALTRSMETADQAAPESARRWPENEITGVGNV